MVSERPVIMTKQDVLDHRGCTVPRRARDPSFKREIQGMLGNIGD